MGNNPREWVSNVPQFARVQYRELYPGIDLVYYGNQGQLEYDYVLKASADPGIITMDFPEAELSEGTHGALNILFQNQSAVFQPPRAY